MKPTLTLLAVLLLAPLSALHAGDAPKQKPNIILFLIDDLGWRDLGCQGSTFYQTPHIDRLAAEGVRFTDAYAACAVCSPTRAAVLTGKYPARLLLTDWLPSGRWNPKAKLRKGRFLRGLPVEELTLAEALREGGYRTASIGKWHLGSEPFCLPEHHGFDVNIGGNAHGAPGSYFFPYPGDWKIPATGQRAMWNVLPDGKEGEYLTDRLTDEAVKFIRESKEQALLPLLPALRRPHALAGQSGSDRQIRAHPEVAAAGQTGVRRDGREHRRQRGPRDGDTEGTAARREHRHHLHQRQRRLLQRHQQRAAAGEQGRVLRRRHPRAAHHQMAGRDASRASS